MEDGGPSQTLVATVVICWAISLSGVPCQLISLSLCGSLAISAPHCQSIPVPIDLIVFLPSVISRSRISHAKMVGFSRLYCSILETTVGVATLGLEPPIRPGGRSVPVEKRGGGLKLICHLKPLP